MESWLKSSLLSLLFYSLWAIASKQASSYGKLSSIESQSITILTMFLLTVYTVTTSGSNKDGANDGFRNISDIPVKGAVVAIAAGLLTYVAGKFYSLALQTGDGSTVSAISGAYPAIAFVINVVVGWEDFSGYKFVGLLLAVGSCIAFSQG
jgi:uncharacterized membrane protein